ncbi:MAG: HAD-IB family hydrolase [Deltaproteobacteria bacterium]|nr:HAD-IB family hydrolase [Deltaproteobacteria bacterium]
MSEKRIAAFFDFDNTFLAKDSAAIGIKYLFKRGDISFWFILGIIVRSIFFKLNLYSAERISRYVIRFYKNRDISEYTRQSEIFYKEMLKPHISPTVKERLEDHRKKGHLLILITASLRYILEPVVKDFGFHLLLCTDLEIGKDGRPTGRPIEPICVGKNKVIYAKKAAEEFDIDLSKSYAYSDHHSDIPLLKLVGNPIVVNPNFFLRREAIKNNWPILEHY